MIIPVGQYAVLSSRGINTRKSQAIPWSIMDQLWARGEIIKIAVNSDILIH